MPTSVQLSFTESQWSQTTQDVRVVENLEAAKAQFEAVAALTMQSPPSDNCSGHLLPSFPDGWGKTTFSTSKRKWRGSSKRSTHLGRRTPMPTPSEIRTEALRALRATQKQLNSPAWVLSIEEEDATVRREAALRLLDVQRAKLRLENAELADIRDQLSANETELTKGRTALEAALKKLQRVREVLDSVRSFLGVVEKVVPKV
jgi:hypothetical protein